MYNESLYAAEFAVSANASVVPINELLLGAIAVWSAFFPGPLPAVNFVPSYVHLAAPQIGHIECDNAVSTCTILISNEYNRPDVVMLHEVGHAYLFGVYPIADAAFHDNHWTASNSLMSSHIGTAPARLQCTVELIADGAATHLCVPSCHCRRFDAYPAAPLVCGGTRPTLYDNADYLLPLLAVLLAGLVLFGIAISATQTRGSYQA